MGIGIILLVATEAIGRRITVELRQVAFFAFHFDMQTKQGKATKPVLELSYLPAFFVMTGFTFLA